MSVGKRCPEMTTLPIARCWPRCKRLQAVLHVDDDVVDDDDGDEDRF